MGKKHYRAVDGLRAIACVGILLMHMAANNDYSIGGFVYSTMIPSFTNFVFLFMAVSAFGMCCGYYEKVLKGQVSFVDFYGRRFRKILPFFGLLVVLDAAMSRSASALVEAFADLTLLFGFLPEAGNLSVIGVGWFLGLVFVFYLCFPFYCVLIQTKRRAWLAFGVSLVYNAVCSGYFHVGRSNILYSGCFFLAGGLLYLYKDQIARWGWWSGAAATAFGAWFYYGVNSGAAGCLLVSAALVVLAIQLEDSPKAGLVLKNRGVQFLAGISMEFYLSHMVVFRAAEKIGANRWFGNGVLQYAATVAGVFAGAVIFSLIVKRGLAWAAKLCQGKMGA